MFCVSLYCWREDTYHAYDMTSTLYGELDGGKKKMLAFWREKGVAKYFEASHEWVFFADNLTQIRWIRDVCSS